MKIHNKSLFILINIILYTYIICISSKAFSYDSLANNENSDTKLNAKITKEESGNSYDSLIIKDIQGRLKFEHDFYTGSSSNFEDLFLLDMLSSKEKTPQKAQEIKSIPKIEEKINQQSNIYNISFSPKFDPKQDIQTAKKLLRTGQSKQAENLLDRAYSYSGKNSWFLAEIAENYKKLHKYDKAEKSYQRAVSANPNRIELLYTYALFLYNTGNLTKSEQVLNKIIKINPDFTLAYYNLGNIYYKKAQYYKAIEAFSQSFKLNPLCADAYYNTALILENLKFKPLAVKYYTKCLELKPNDLQTQKALKRLS